MGLRIHSGSRGFPTSRRAVVGYIRVLVGSATSGRWFHSGSREFTREHLGVVGFILDCVGTLRRAYLSSGSSGFEWVHLGAPMGRRVVFTWTLLWVVDFFWEPTRTTMNPTTPTRAQVHPREPGCTRRPLGAPE